MNTNKIIEEFEKIGIFKKNEICEMTKTEYVISEIDKKWNILSSEEQNRICFLLLTLLLKH